MASAMTLNHVHRLRWALRLSYWVLNGRYSLRFVKQQRHTLIFKGQKDCGLHIRLRFEDA